MASHQKFSGDLARPFCFASRLCVGFLVLLTPTESTQAARTFFTTTTQEITMKQFRNEAADTVPASKQPQSVSAKQARTDSLPGSGQPASPPAKQAREEMLERIYNPTKEA